MNFLFVVVYFSIFVAYYLEKKTEKMKLKKVIQIFKMFKNTFYNFGVNEILPKYGSVKSPM